MSGVKKSYANLEKKGQHSANIKYKS
ncbi:UNVERIFIED_CONTAM: hypothetical protein NCL1_62306 [Trichonephila clavipes]